MLGRLAAALAVTFILLPSAFAQDEPPPPAPAPAPGPAVTPAHRAAGGTVIAPAFAKKGVMEVEGGLGFDFSKQGEADASIAINLGPTFRYFVIDGLSVGGNLTLGYSKQGDSSFTTIYFLPAAEYNFDLGSRLYPYAGMMVGLAYMTFSSTDPITGESSSEGKAGFYAAPEGGVKVNFGGGILGLGLQIPIQKFADIDMSFGVSLITRYGVFF
jgi:hypothetical protein